MSSATPKNRMERLTDKDRWTEECRLRLVNKQRSDWIFRVPGLFVTLLEGQGGAVIVKDVFCQNPFFKNSRNPMCVTPCLSFLLTRGVIDMTYLG